MAHTIKPEARRYAALDSEVVTDQTAVFSPRLNTLLSPKGVFKGTREEWLEAAALIMAAWLNEAMKQKSMTRFNRKKDASKYVALDITLGQHCADHYGGKPSDYNFKPNSVRYATSLLGGQGIQSGNALAHAHLMHSTGNGYHEIRMGAHIGGRKTKNDSCRIADILLHEMIHTMAPRCGHKGAFALIARTLGLEGKLTATVASQHLRTTLWDRVVTVLGKYPHNAVKFVPRGQRKKGSRLIKCICLKCEFNFRTTRKWISKAEGVLTCPIGCGQMAIIGHEYKEDEQE
tara:strand:+ start:1337 stop:2203 length:867 start_codon:yes stop_codon:yes gene_type:complete